MKLYEHYTSSGVGSRLMSIPLKNGQCLFLSTTPLPGWWMPEAFFHVNLVEALIQGGGRETL